MKANSAHVSYLLDRSGSMRKILSDTIGGFNTFVDGQREEPGELTVTLAQFDDIYEVLYQTVPIAEVKNLTEKTFVPRGRTALLDSLARLIIDTGRTLAALAEDQRPEKVLFIIQTDGEENASREFSNAKIKEMIDHQKDIYKWEFIYLGANQDAFSVGGAMGMAGVKYEATSMGTRGAYTATTDSLKKFRRDPVGSSFSLRQEDVDNLSK